MEENVTRRQQLLGLLGVVGGVGLSWTFGSLPRIDDGLSLQAGTVKTQRPACLTAE